jgi:acetyl-CoA carboxylase carboxyl transferase subunit alpha
MASMSQLPVPIISIVIGEGGSEAALAMGVADKILMQENAIYSPITPEAAATLLYRDTARAVETSTTLRLTAIDCKDLGIIDQIISEPEGGAHINPAESAHLLQRTLMREISTLTRLFAKQKPRRLVQSRQKKFRNMGEYSSHFGAAIAKEITTLQGYISTGIQNLKHRRDKNLL